MAIPVRKVLDDARTVLGQHPALGRTTTVARAELVDQVQTRVRVGRHVFTTDEPEVAGGYGTAPSPVHYALGALAACEAVTFRYWSELLEMPFGGVEIQVRGESDIRGFLGFDPSSPPGLSRVRVEVDVHGPLTAARYQELHDAVRAHCPVFRAFAGSVPIESQLISRYVP
jgi:putative redox protein